MKLTDKMWNALGKAEVQGSEYHTILIEDEYGYKYWLWFYQGTIEECIKLFKEKRPDSCLVEVSVLNADSYSLVSEVDYKTWCEVGETANGFAHWHEPDDSYITIEDESGNRFDWHDEDAIRARYEAEDEIDEEVQDYLNNHGQGVDEDYYPNQEESELYRDSPEGSV